MRTKKQHISRRKIFKYFLHFIGYSERNSFYLFDVVLDITTKNNILVLKLYIFVYIYINLSGPLPRLANITDTPSRILKLDLSLNELTALEHDGLLPFRQVRELNASLNRINK